MAGFFIHAGINVSGTKLQLVEVFSSTGEVLDLREKAPTWRNIKLGEKMDDFYYKGGDAIDSR